MNTAETIDKVFYYLNDGFTKGNLDSWVELFADDFVMDEQLAGHVEGVEPIKALARGMLNGYSKWIQNPWKVITQGDEAFVFWDIEAITSNGVEINAKGANFYRVKNGKLVYLTNCHDTVPFNTETAFTGLGDTYKAS